MTAEEIYAIPANDSGWRELPNGNVWFGEHVILGDHVHFDGTVILGSFASLGDNSWLGDRVILGDHVVLDKNVRLGNNVMLGNGVRIDENARIGENARIDTNVILGHNVILGNNVILGDRVVLGDNLILGDNVRLGDNVHLGENVWLGNNVMLGENVTLDNNMTSKVLNLNAIEAYKAAGDSHVFVKWVTPERKSPNFDGGTVVEYPKGAIVTAEGEVSDQSCAAGLHVLRVGVRPEHIGIPNHPYIGLLVRVKSEDILHAGMPGNDAKLRVRRLEVLT